jgi:hypothetical protein
MILSPSHHRCLLAFALVLACAPLALAQNGAIAGVAVNATSDQPLAHAAIELLLQSDRSTVATQWTGDDGRFRFEHLADGKYELVGTRNGFLRTDYEQHGDFSSAVVVGADQSTDALTLRLRPEATLRGTVIGEAGEPVEAATVTLFRRPASEQDTDKILRMASRKTDDTGSYEFAHLEPGAYSLVVNAEPWFALHSTRDDGPATLRALDLVYPRTYFDGVTDEAQAAAIPLESGEQARADLRLAAVPALHLKLPPGTSEGPPALRQTSFGFYFPDENAPLTRGDQVGAVAPGHYLLSTGNPARQIAVTLSTSGAIELAGAEPLVELSGKLDLIGPPPPRQYLQLTFYPEHDNNGQQPYWVVPRDGKFHTADLQAGRWRLELVNGYGHAYSIDSIESQGKRTPGNRLALAGGKAEITLHARLAEQNIEGFARKAGHGVAGAMILLVPDDLTQHPQQARRDQSDSDGSFSLREVAAGRYTLVAIEDGWSLDWRQPDALARYLPAGQRVTVQGGPQQTLHLPDPVMVQPR